MPSRRSSRMTSSIGLLRKLTRFSAANLKSFKTSTFWNTVAWPEPRGCASPCATISSMSSRTSSWRRALLCRPFVGRRTRLCNWCAGSPYTCQTPFGHEPRGPLSDDVAPSAKRQRGMSRRIEQVRRCQPGSRSSSLKHNVLDERRGLQRPSQPNG